MPFDWIIRKFHLIADQLLKLSGAQSAELTSVRVMKTCNEQSF